MAKIGNLHYGNYIPTEEDRKNDETVEKWKAQEREKARQAHLREQATRSSPFRRF